MAVEFIIKVPGLFKAEGVVAVFYGEDHIKAIAVNKAIVVTSGPINEWIAGDDVEHVVSNQEHSGIDEAVEMEDAEELVIQSAARLALFACEPGPVAEKFLTRLVEDAHFATSAQFKAEQKVAKKSDKQSDAA